MVIKYLFRVTSSFHCINQLFFYEHSSPSLSLKKEDIQITLLIQQPPGNPMSSISKGTIWTTDKNSVDSYSCFYCNCVKCIVLLASIHNCYCGHPRGELEG
jgi:hypothetical protein